MATLLAILPVFLVIGVGWLVRATGVLPREQWVGVSRLAYWVFFPALLFSVISRADFGALDAGPFVIAAAGGFATMGVLVLALRPLLRSTPGPSYTSIVQAGLRWNGVVLLALADPVFGPEGALLAALMFAPVVPLVNFLSVAALSIWGSGTRPTAGRFIARLATNPLILACAAGAAANVTGALAYAPAADRAIGLLGDAGLAAGLIGIGAGLDLASLRGKSGLLVLAIGLKLLVMPAVLWGWAVACGASPLATLVLVAGGATPGAAASYVLAREMGGDSELTAAHVTATTLLAFLALPAWIWLVGAA